MRRFSLEWVAHLHARPLGGVVVALLGEPGRGQHAHPADAVAPGGGPEQDGQVALAGGRAQHEALLGHDPHAQHVHQGIAGIIPAAVGPKVLRVGKRLGKYNVKTPLVARRMEL